MSKGTDEKLPMKLPAENTTDKPSTTTNQPKEEPRKLKLNIGAQAYIPKSLQQQLSYGQGQGQGPMMMPQGLGPGVNSSIYHKTGPGQSGSSMIQSTYLYNTYDSRSKYYPPMQPMTGGNPLTSMTNAPTPENIQKMIKTSKPFFPKNVQIALNKDDLIKVDDDKKTKGDDGQDKKGDKDKDKDKGQQGKLSGLVEHKSNKAQEDEETLIKKKNEEEQLRLKVQKEQEEKEKEKEKERLKKQAADDEKKNYTIKDNYFLFPISVNKTSIKLHGFSNEYMMSFKPWKITQETKLLSEEVMNHLIRFKTCEEELPKNQKDYTKNHHNNKRDFDRGSNKHLNQYPNQKKRDKDDSSSSKPFSKPSEKPTSISNVATEVNIGQWGRKDITKELVQAEQFKEKMNEIEQKDPMRFQLTELLNILTVDNYDETKDSIFNMIKGAVDSQEKFLDVLFTKAVNEKAFVFLYAKLCKDLDKKLPQKSEKISMNKKPTSAMRSKLLDKSREIFKIENNTKFDSYINLNDPDERELKMKKFVLGNVNFIGELINIQVLSKKIVFQCIENLFKRYEKEDGDEILHLINLEAIVIMMDKFGTLVKKQQKKIMPADLEDYNKKIDEIIAKLDKIQFEKKLPGYIKYKIINLIEKKKDNWEESQFEKISVAKGKEEVRKEYEDSLKPLSSSVLSSSSNKELCKYSQEAINQKIREDLSSWKNHIEDGHKPENYNWEIVEELYSIRKHSIAEILLAYVENCIDFVSKVDNLQYATKYFKDFISFYSHNLKGEERDSVVAQVIKLLQEVSNLALDNNLIIDVWGNILYQLLKEKVMAYTDFDTFKELMEDDIKAIFQVFGKVIEIDGDAKANFSVIKLVKENLEMFNSITKA